MKKLLFILLPVLLFSCASTKNLEKEPSVEDFPYSSYNLKAGEEVHMPINTGFLFYGKTNFVDDDWDFSLPECFGNKTLVTTLPYTFYFNGKKEEVFYELIIKDVNLYPEIAEMEMFSEIKQETIIGTAACDNPKIMIRSVTGDDPNLLLDTKNLWLDFGDYRYFDAATLMPTTPKFLTFMPVSSKDDLIEFWDYPETIEELAFSSLSEEGKKSSYTSFPIFQIMIKTKLEQYPEEIKTNSMNDLFIRNQFYPECETELKSSFDGVPFRLIFYKGFYDYLIDEYTLGDDIYLFLTSLFSKEGELYFYVRDFSLASPEEMYEERLRLFNELMNK